MRAAAVSRKEKGESEGEEKLTDPFVIPERNVELEVILCERVGAGCLRQEGGAIAEGGGALEGSRGEAFLRPRASEVVSFLAFHERGLGYPAH